MRLAYLTGKELSEFITKYDLARDDIIIEIYEEELNFVDQNPGPNFNGHDKVYVLYQDREWKIEAYVDNPGYPEYSPLETMAVILTEGKIAENTSPILKGGITHE